MGAVSSTRVAALLAGDPSDQHPAGLERMLVRAGDGARFLPQPVAAAVQLSRAHYPPVTEPVGGHPTHSVVHTFES